MQCYLKQHGWTQRLKSERKRQISHDMTYMWNLKYDTSQRICKDRLTDIENTLVVAQGREGKGGKEWECGISRTSLLQRRRINNKVLLYSTGNYIQYPMRNHNGKEYICVQLSHFTVKKKYNIVNQLYFNSFCKKHTPFLLYVN